MMAMKSALAVFSCLALGAVSSLRAYEIKLYVDSAPNVYGSPDYAPWWSQAKADAMNGTFVNMANSVNAANAGTTGFEMSDTVVYSFGDLGRRLHFVYWVPGATINGLAADNFQIAMDYVWDGVTYDYYNENYGTTWLTPTKWEQVEGGVIGTAGFAWWGAYGVNTQAALEAELAEWKLYQGDITLHTRVGDGPAVSLTACRNVPDTTSTMLLFGLSLAAVASSRRFLHRA